MAFEKAIIFQLDEKFIPMGLPVEVLFNPGEYTVTKSNQFQNTVVPGLSVPITHFINGNAETLTMDLFFDTYEKGEDVRKHTKKITGLLEINSHIHAPPICMFVWGKLIFRAVLESVTQKFTLFLDSGVPARATLNVTFREYKTVTEQFLKIPRFSSDRTKQRQLIEGDSIWLVAHREYGDAAYWRHIAKANNIDNPRKINAGRELTLPPLEK